MVESRLDNIKRIIGTFWLQIFSDSWLISNILKLYETYILNRLTCFQQNLLSSLSLSTQTLDSHYSYKQLYIDAQQVQPYTTTTLDNSAVGNKFNPDKTFQTLIASLAPKNKVTVYGNCRDCVQLKTSLLDNKSFQVDTDYYIINDQLVLSDDAYAEIKKYADKKLIDKDGLRWVYKIWGVVPKYDLADRCCSTLGLPLSWLVKYPKFVQLAFKVHLSGLSKTDAIQLLNHIALVYVFSRF